MKIGIDISQIAYEKTGVANYLQALVEHLVTIDTKNEYILFFSSMRKKLPISTFESLKKNNVTIKQFRFPPTFLDLIWNKLHILPVESLIGPVDVFISSDWTQPPTKHAKQATIIYDVIVYKYPEETSKIIVETQKRRLAWVKKECEAIFCISESTKRDVHAILGIPEEKLYVTYPGFSL